MVEGLVAVRQETSYDLHVPLALLEMQHVARFSESHPFYMWDFSEKWGNHRITGLIVAAVQ